MNSELERARALMEEGNLDEAFELYLRAAEEGSAEAEYRLGQLWENAECEFMEDCEDYEIYPKAEEYYMNAAEKGHGPAALALAKLYFSSYYYPSCFEPGLRWYERAAESGEREAMEYMAAHEEAVRTQAAAEAGDPEAMVKAAKLLFAGRYLARNEAQAESYLRSAAVGGYLTAVEEMADRLYRRRHFKEAAVWFERALELGSDKVIMPLAGLYADDYGAGRNAQRARELYLLALEKGEAEALSKLGDLYSRDPDLYDSSKARRYFREYESRTGKHSHGADEIEEVAELFERAERGDAEAAFKLGEAFEYEGRGVPRDYYSKRKWYERAAELGHVKAMEKVADSYYFGAEGNGKDKAVDRKKAAVWYERAAEQGRKFAIHRIAFMYHDGEGVERDLKKAIAWMELLKDDVYFRLDAKQLLERWKQELGE